MNFEHFGSVEIHFFVYKFGLSRISRMSKFFTTSIKQFEYYKMLGEKAMEQVTDEQLFIKISAESNSIAVIVKHLWGNMLSRWTDFLTADGEKEWRDREGEFVDDMNTRVELLQKWNEGWACLLNTLKNLKPEDEHKIVYIRNQGHTVQEAVMRQLAHYPYHVGQMVYLGKYFADSRWKSLSIPKGGSSNYNKDKFLKEKGVRHFTDEYLK